MTFSVVLLATIVCAISSSFAQDVCKFDNNLDKNTSFYPFWISIEGTADVDVSGQKIVLDGIKNTTLQLCDTPGNGVLVSPLMFDACEFQYERICELEDGTLYQGVEDKECFEKLDHVKYPWGKADKDAFQLYSSVAAKGVPLGTTLLITELIGITLPHSTIPHNGCVRVDDVCKYCEVGCKELIFHTGLYSYFSAYTWPERVTAKEANCEIKKYD